MLLMETFGMNIGEDENYSFLRPSCEKTFFLIVKFFFEKKKIYIYTYRQSFQRRNVRNI